jgi:hypothetical protein
MYVTAKDIQEKIIKPGYKLIDIEVEEDGVCGCGPEVTLSFSGGKEIVIYNHPENGLTVEED